MNGSNPYYSPQPLETATGVKHRSVLPEAGVVLAAVLAYAVVGLGGAVLMRLYSPRPELVLLEALAFFYWADRVGSIIAAIPGQLLCGAILGSGLRRVQFRWVLASLLALYCLAIAGDGAFLRADDGLWIDSVGYFGAALQFTLQIGSALAAVSIGIWLGRRGRTNA